MTETAGPERTTYDKLVRDRIPDLIRSAGRTLRWRRCQRPRSAWRFSKKLVEEATEAKEAGAAGGSDALLAELADLQEVLDAVVDAFGLTPAEVAAAQSERRTERGGFTRRLRLLWTERSSCRRMTGGPSAAAGTRRVHLRQEGRGGRAFELERRRLLDFGRPVRGGGREGGELAKQTQAVALDQPRRAARPARGSPTAA